MCGSFLLYAQTAQDSDSLELRAREQAVREKLEGLGSHDMRNANSASAFSTVDRKPGWRRRLAEDVLQAAYNTRLEIGGGNTSR